MKLRIEFLDGTVPVARVLAQDVVRLGAAADNDVVLDGPANAHHAELRREGGAYTLVDLASEAGTWIAGERVLRHVVASGDEATFGAGGRVVRFTVLDAAPGDAPTPAPSPA
ncbi:MAG TPA: FHA domain-containing protein, partial [Minicystis sp.]|nr:FHA domain-containing protein [Minicystis sp.]